MLTYAQVCRALETFGVSGADLDAVWRLLAAVLLLGTIEFAPSDPAQSESGDAEVARVADDKALATAAAALGCSVEGLRFPLLSKNMVVMNDKIVQYFTCKAAGQARDAFARDVACRAVTRRDVLQHVAARCSTLQHVAARCSTLQHVSSR